jgi:hypothetical protein
MSSLEQVKTVEGLRKVAEVDAKGNPVYLTPAGLSKWNLYIKDRLESIILYDNQYNNAVNTTNTNPILANQSLQFLKSGVRGRTKFYDLQMDLLENFDDGDVKPSTSMFSKTPTWHKLWEKMSGPLNDIDLAYRHYKPLQVPPTAAATSVLPTAAATSAAPPFFSGGPAVASKEEYERRLAALLGNPAPTATSAGPSFLPPQQFFAAGASTIPASKEEYERRLAALLGNPAPTATSAAPPFFSGGPAIASKEEYERRLAALLGNPPPKGQGGRRSRRKAKKSRRKAKKSRRHRR